MISENRQLASGPVTTEVATRTGTRRKINNVASALSRLVGRFLLLRHRPLGWGLGFYGLSLYLVALSKAHGWSPATISAAITFYYIAGAFLVMQVGDTIEKRGARIVVLVGVGLMGLGVLGLTVSGNPGTSTSPSW